MHLKMHYVLLPIAFFLAMASGSLVPVHDDPVQALLSKVAPQGTDGAVPEAGGAAAAADVPQAEGGGAAVPEAAAADGSAAVPQQADGAAAVPQQADGAAAVPPQADGAAAVPDGGSNDLPMYKVHDAATEAMGKRMTLPEGEACDTDFGTLLEKKMDEMETNKEADQDYANKLDGEFKEILNQQPDARLCVTGFWCDLGSCKPLQEGNDQGKRGKIRQLGRALGNPRSARDGEAAESSSSTVPPEKGGGVVSSTVPGEKQPIDPVVSGSSTAGPAPAPAVAATTAAAPMTADKNGTETDGGSASFQSSLTLVVLAILGLYCILTI